MENTVKRSIYFAIVLFFLVAVTFSLGQTTVKSENMAVSTGWLAEHETDPGLVVLHVGVDRKTYDAGHIPGARFVPMSDLIVVRNGVPNQVPAAGEIKKVLEKLGVGDTSHVVVYGDGPLLATHVYFLLDYIGHQHHAIVDGGMNKWKAEKRALSTAAAEFKPTALTVKTHPELLVDLASVQKIVAEKKMLVIDGRPVDQYSGVTPGEAIKRSGHIPGSKNVVWTDTLAGTTDPVLKPVGDIRAIYEAAGATTGKDVVLYCRTGLIAKHEYFTMKLAGFHAVVFDGSFLEWSNAANTEVAKGRGGF